MLASFLPHMIVGLGLLFGFTNGMNDSGSLAAAMVSSGADNPRQILLLIAGAQLFGALSGGVAVAYTIGQDIIDVNLATGEMVAVALAAAILWGVIAQRLGVPTSSAHALIGALAGATWAQAGAQAVQWRTVGVLFLALLAAPVLGYVATFLFMKGLVFALYSAKPKVGLHLQRAQWLLAPLVAVGQGSNYAQRVMGIVALGLFSVGALPSFSIPLWLQSGAAVILSAGTTFASLRVLRTVGYRIHRMRPIHGFATLAASGLAVVGASALGMPVSTTQIMSASVAGAGSARRMSDVRWGIIGHIIEAWFLTIPATCALAALMHWAVMRLQ